jgi:hypothetical protein
MLCALGGAKPRNKQKLNNPKQDCYMRGPLGENPVKIRDFLGSRIQKIAKTPVISRKISLYVANKPWPFFGSG